MSKLITSTSSCQATGRRSESAAPRRSSFHSTLAEIKLFRLEAGAEHDDRNLKVRARAANAFGIPRFEIPRDVAVELEASRMGDGLYRVTPIGPLPPGE